MERMLHAAAAAPSSMNEQPWHYHVATGQARAEVGKIVAEATVHLVEYIDQLGPERYEHALQWYSSLGDAPVLIGVSMSTPSSKRDGTNKMLAVGASIQNLLLAATAQGLGACNITFTSWVREELDEFFAVPEGRQIVAMISVGYPSEIEIIAPRHREDIATWYE